MQRYLQTTRTRTCSLLFALPLLLLYEAGAWWMAERAGGLRNGADVLLRSLLAAGGVTGTLAFTAAVVCAGAVQVARERRRRRVRLRAAVFAGMLAESALYAAALGVVVGTLTAWLLGAAAPLAAGGGPLDRLPAAEAVVLSLGAGVYEELLFRVLLVGGLAALLRALGVGVGAAGWTAAAAGALLFSAFHYVGPHAYPLEPSGFTFRFLAGLAFSALFLLRGFGIAAWTHALYDVFLVLAGPGG